MEIIISLLYLTKCKPVGKDTKIDIWPILDSKSQLQWCFEIYKTFTLIQSFGSIFKVKVPGKLLPPPTFFFFWWIFELYLNGSTFSGLSSGSITLVCAGLPLSLSLPQALNKCLINYCKTKTRTQHRYFMPIFPQNWPSGLGVLEVKTHPKPLWNLRSILGMGSTISEICLLKWIP